MFVALIVEGATIAHVYTPVWYGAETAPRVDSVLLHLLFLFIGTKSFTRANCSVTMPSIDRAGSVEINLVETKGRMPLPLGNQL